MAILRRTSKTTGKVAYQVLVDRRDPVTGDRRRVTVGTYRTKKDAQKAERDALVQQERGTLLDPAKTTVAELLESWLQTKHGEITSQSVRDYEIIIRKHIIPALGAIPVQKLTAPRLQAQYGAWADAGLSPRMIRGCHMRLSQALRQAVRFGIVASNVCDSASPPKLARPKAETWSPEEAARFLDTVMHRPVLHRGGDSGQRRPDELHPLWHLLLLEGMRRGEALGLRWRDVNWERGTAHISQTVAPDKSNKGAAMIQPRTKTLTGARSVRLTARTLAALRDHRKAQLARRLAAPEWQDHDLVVCTGRGTPVNPNNVSRSFEALVKAAGLRRIRVHDLRHTSATLLLLAGTPAKVVSERLGHASIGITIDLYSHVLPEMQGSAADAMDGVFDQVAGIGGERLAGL
jgi:integrase